MILFSKISYPTESVKKIAERFLEAQQVSDFMKKQRHRHGKRGKS